MTGPLHLAGSLDRLRELTAATRTPYGRPGCAVTVAGADHGVARRGVSTLRYGDTFAILRLVASRHSPVGRLCRANGLDLYPLNVGCTNPGDDASHVISTYHTQAGSGDISHEQAMTREVAARLLERAESFVAARDPGCICLGEVGIGNTTAASALTCRLLDLSPEGVVGRGSGLRPEAVDHKRTVVAEALARDCRSAADTLDVLAALGGLEIAWNVGLVLAAWRRRRFVFLDGFISSVAGLVAQRLEPGAGAVLVATHLSSEPGHTLVLAALGLKPFLDLTIGLGQGFGSALGYSFLRQTDAAVYHS